MGSGGCKAQGIVGEYQGALWGHKRGTNPGTSVHRGRRWGDRHPHFQGGPALWAAGLGSDSLCPVAGCWLAAPLCFSCALVGLAGHTEKSVSSGGGQTPVPSLTHWVALAELPMGPSRP